MVEVEVSGVRAFRHLLPPRVYAKMSGTAVCFGDLQHIRFLSKLAAAERSDVGSVLEQLDHNR